VATIRKTARQNSKLGPAWLFAPLFKTPNRELAKRYVARGWAKNLEQVFVELTDKQRARRQRKG
jgi:hypothetical protein